MDAHFVVNADTDHGAVAESPDGVGLGPTWQKLQPRDEAVMGLDDPLQSLQVEGGVDVHDAVGHGAGGDKVPVITDGQRAQDALEGRSLLQGVALWVPPDQVGRGVARPNRVRDGVGLVLSVVALDTAVADALVHELELAGRVPAHLGMPSAFGHVPDTSRPVLGDGDHLGAVGAKVEIVDLLIVRVLDLMDTVKLRERPDSDDAVLTTRCGKFPVRTDLHDFLVGILGGEVCLYGLHGINAERQPGLRRSRPCCSSVSLSHSSILKTESACFHFLFARNN